MASGHNDPKLLYAIEGVAAYHIANGTEQSLTPSGPQTLSLLMVPTSSAFADPSNGSSEEDFYLHLHLPPELDLPLPATTQIYHQPPTSYLIPRWDLGPSSGAFTRIEFPPRGSRSGIQEDVDTFETILAQCTAFLERAPAPKPRSKAAEAASDAASAKAREAAGEQLPAYNPADYNRGEGYVQGSHSSNQGGRIVLVDEEDGSVIGELSEGFQVKEDGAVRPGSKDPVEITFASDGTQAIAVQPATSFDYVEDEIHPAYKKSTLVSSATKASRLLITTSDIVTKTLQNQADSFTKNTKPVKPMTFNPATHERIRRINTFSTKAAAMSATTVGSITKVAQNFGATVTQRSNKEGRARGYDKDGNVIASYKPGVLNKSLMAFNTVVDGMEQAGRNLLSGTSSSMTTVVGHRWGPEAGEVSRHLGGGVKNVGLVYIDVTGVSRRAILKSVAKGMVVGHVKGGGQVVVGGAESSQELVPTSSGALQDNQSIYADSLNNGSSYDPKGKKTAYDRYQYGEASDDPPNYHPAIIYLPSGQCADLDAEETAAPFRAMLHEILLSLSGHPSPLLRADASDAQRNSGITPPERQLLATAAHLSDVHINLITSTAHVSASHPSIVCRAVANGIRSIHLAAFQRKVLEVEESILRDDPALVGAYNIVPLTAVISEFKGWTRRMDWLWDVVQFMTAKMDTKEACKGSDLLDRLRLELHSGYQDVQEAAMSLVKVAETAWLKQVSGWISYGRLPSSGQYDLFIQKSRNADEEFTVAPSLLPSFVTPTTAASMLFIGKALNHVKVKSTIQSGVGMTQYITSTLQLLADLEFPLKGTSFSRTITAIRLSLSEKTLQKILPLSRVITTLQLLRDFFLLGRGEFAMALTHEADERLRNRWRRADNLAYQKAEGLRDVTVKDGEVAAVLVRTWAVLASMQGQHSEEDDQLELARDLLRLHLVKSTSVPPMTTSSRLSRDALNLLATSPFRNVLFSVPAMLSMQLPSPLDMVLSPSDLHLYSCVNSYLLAMRRAHIRLTDLWKMTSLRRHHPAIRGADEQAVVLRQRWAARSQSMRSAWTTANAAIFFLGETEAYLQTEVVAVLWDSFHAWLNGHDGGETQSGSGWASAAQPTRDQPHNADHDEDEDLWLQCEDKSGYEPPEAATNQSRPTTLPHDPQTLSTAHSLYLGTLVHRLLLTQPTFTQPLYTLLVHLDHLVSHIQRLHSIYTAIDLETDSGVVDAFVDLEKEQAEVKALLRGVEGKVKRGIEEVVVSLRALENNADFVAEWESDGVIGDEDDGLSDDVGYAPARVGGINRLLMKLDFGSWFGRPDEWERNDL
ncbi:Gamma-tubulin complex component 4 [Paramyrothecium foliicola]|nr:Gamma-tubulin complex component 4 [Paramyrothecium foliicola]